MVVRRTLLVDAFAPEAKHLRQHFEQRFADPRIARDDRFVWDLWHVENQYTALRTPAYLYFPKRLYDAFHQRLVWWGRRVLGCHDISPPWMSCYVNACEQRLHGDLPHGQWAFVFSLTPWARRSFRGGETLIVRDQVLDFWSQFQSTATQEEPELVEAIEPRFNRLVVFDPRLPHGVRRVDGSMDPMQGRLVIHGWFVQPRPFIEGPMRADELRERLLSLDAVIGRHIDSGLTVAGFCSFSFSVVSGRVQALKVLSDTTRAAEQDEEQRRALLRAIRGTIQSWSFRKRGGVSTVTLPLVFERG